MVKALASCPPHALFLVLSRVATLEENTGPQLFHSRQFWDILIFGKFFFFYYAKILQNEEGIISAADPC